MAEKLRKDLTPEEEARMVDQICKEVMNRRLEIIAIAFLESIKPVSFIGSQLALVFVAPLMSAFTNLGIDYIKFFENKANVEALLRRIEAETRIKDEQKHRAKEQQNLITKRFGFKLDISPEIWLREDLAQGGLNGGSIGLTRVETAGGGFIVVTFRESTSPPADSRSEISRYLENGGSRHMLALSPDTTFNKLENNNPISKIKGHEVSVETCEWNEKEQRGILECYGLWCNKTKRFFILGMRTKPLTGSEDEERQTEVLRLTLGSLKCHG